MLNRKKRKCGHNGVAMRTKASWLTLLAAWGLVAHDFLCKQMYDHEFLPRRMVGTLNGEMLAGFQSSGWLGNRFR
jgi:hypothetical protein